MQRCQQDPVHPCPFLWPPLVDCWPSWLTATRTFHQMLGYDFTGAEAVKTLPTMSTLALASFFSIQTHLASRSFYKLHLHPCLRRAG